MVDEEPPAYRPRRAFPTEPANDEPTVALTDDDDVPKPLYRDEATSTLPGPGGATPPAGRSAGSTGSADSSGSAARRGEAAPRRSAVSPYSANDETQILSRARERAQATRSAAAAGSGAARSRPTRRPSQDADSTTVLPRTATGARVSRRPDVIDDDIDEGAGRGRQALLVGIVAAVVVVGLVIGYLIVNLSKPTAAPGTTSPPSSGASVTTDPSASATPSAPVAAILTDASLITADAAKTLDSGLTWKVALTQRGLTADSPLPACLQGNPADGQPTAQQTLLRLVSASGTDAPGVLHEALAYTSPEEAAQAYALMRQTIGGCEMTGAYITQGRAVTGLGDEATGVVVSVTEAGKVTFRSLVMARTGRVIDLVDVARPKDDVSFNRVVEVAGTAVESQCAAAGGTCIDNPTSKVAPPPIGGDEPGFLTVGDLPPVGSTQQAWVGVAPGLPDAGNKYSNCETTDFTKTEAQARAKRTYLLENDTSRFGLDEVIVSAKSDKAASDLADKIKSDWESCKTRGLTATVPKPTAIDGVGAKSAAIAGWVTTVTQKAGTTSTKYRVGVVVVGSKVVFTFVNSKADLDFTDDQFATVTVRAGQRATQVN